MTLLTGFLGAGKTTTLRHVLREGATNVCVVENEFGAANIDSEVVETLGPGLVKRLNGCICCAVQTDLVATFLDLARVCAARGVERVVVETTGMAEPGVLVPLFRRGTAIGVTFRLSSVVTVVDARHGEVDLENSPVSQGQVAAADLLVINKLDAASTTAVERLVRALESVNPVAEVVRVERGQLPAARFFADAEPTVHLSPWHGGPTPHGDIQAVVVADAGPHDLRRLRAFLVGLSRALRDDLLRCKGFAHATGRRRVLVQGVRDDFEFEPFGRPPAGTTPETRLVFIGRALDTARLTAALVACRVSDVQSRVVLRQDAS